MQSACRRALARTSRDHQVARPSPIAKDSRGLHRRAKGGEDSREGYGWIHVKIEGEPVRRGYKIHADVCKEGREDLVVTRKLYARITLSYGTWRRRGNAQSPLLYLWIIRQSVWAWLQLKISESYSPHVWPNDFGLFDFAHVEEDGRAMMRFGPIYQVRSQKPLR